jgi:hypothetical protein
MSEMRTSSDGCKRWFDDENRLHRTDGPAEEWPDGSKCWHLNGVRHRIDGPAFEKPTGYKEWWVNGEQMTGEQFQEWRRQEDERAAREQREWEAMVDNVCDEGLDHPVKPMPKPEIVRKMPGAKIG